ncbi:MAG: HepT-like ribonuclease domain-containing protein [Asticcacaulis sp.]
MHILAIDEICRTLPDDLMARHAPIPWRQIVGMRNLLAHEYFIRESAIIWQTVKTGLPELAAICRVELNRPVSE